MYLKDTSHRARQKAFQAIGVKKGLYSMRHNHHYYPITPEEAEILSKIKGCTIVEKLPGSPDHWFNTW